MTALVVTYPNGKVLSAWRDTENPDEIDISDLPAGVYFFTVSIGGKRLSRKVVKLSC